MQEISKKRDSAIDIMKAILILEMVLVHVVSVLGNADARTKLDEVRTITYLVSFSGFLFCFGYTSQLAYFSREPGYKRILVNVIRIFIAYYISSFANLLFYEKLYSTADFVSVLTFSKIPRLSEFIPGFALAILAGVLFYKGIQALLKRPYIFFAVCGALLLTTFLPAQNIKYAQAGLFVGIPMQTAVTFPIVPFFPLYLMGMYFARHHIHPSWVLSIFGMIAFFIYKYIFGAPDRFPPDFLWIFFSIFFVFGWYLLSIYLSRWGFLLKLLTPIGANTLFYLLMSNILIFAFHGILTKLELSLKATFEMTAAITFLTYFLVTIIKPIPHQIGNAVVIKN